ncbi:MAG: hypothetical protein ACK4ZX_05490, partial [Thermus sp.]
DQPDELVAFKDGPPLIVGLGQDEYFVVSDVSAALSYTKDFVYLEDREVVRYTWPGQEPLPKAREKAPIMEHGPLDG